MQDWNTTTTVRGRASRHRRAQRIALTSLAVLATATATAGAALAVSARHASAHEPAAAPGAAVHRAATQSGKPAGSRHPMLATSAAAPAPASTTSTTGTPTQNRPLTLTTKSPQTTPAATGSAPRAGTPSHTASGLPTVRDLPGYGRQVSAAGRDLLTRSIVHVDSRPRGGTDYGNDCTGTKVSIAGRIFVLTAAHCLEIPGDHYLSGAPARRATGLTPDQFGVDTSHVTDSAAASTVLPARMIVESQTADAALLSIDDRGPNAAAFDAVPALTLLAHLAASTALAGQGTFSSSYEIYAYHRVDGAGVLLGRGTGVNGPWPGAQDDLVALTNPGVGRSPQRDACLFGGSGSLAMLADGRVTGPLSGRDRKGPYANGWTTGEDYTLQQSLADRRYLDGKLGVQTRPYPTICFYTVLTVPIVNQMVRLFPDDRPDAAPRK